MNPAPGSFSAGWRLSMLVVLRAFHIQILGVRGIREREPGSTP